MLSNRAWSGPRALLTKEQAAEIYMIRKADRQQGIDPILGSRSAQIAKTYGVSPKAIRDIWNRRTWQNETRHLWDKHEQPVIRYKKPVLLSNQRELLSESWESYGTDRSDARSEISASHLLSLSARPEPRFTGYLTKSMVCSYSCDIPEGIKVQFAPPAMHPPPKVEPHSRCITINSVDNSIAPAYLEGPFGPFLPPASAGDVDPFHADWPHW